MTGRTYTLTDLDESRDPTLGCCLCLGTLEPGEPLTYRAAAEGGFAFYHPDCALAPDELADTTGRTTR